MNRGTFSLTNEPHQNPDPADHKTSQEALIDFTGSPVDDVAQSGGLSSSTVWMKNQVVTSLEKLVSCL
ncbi:hypothetical protein AMECASPLE_000721 [Ameca splendens]|uniref:Uncharacterized protein n=1 Tax=Ameca splendens TaxID=208324 RepID=A0ABV0YJU8_9TELE